MSDQAAIEAETTSKTLLVKAYACDDHGDGPSYAKVILTPALIARLLSLREMVKSSDLMKATVSCSPDSWGPNGIEDDLRFSAAQLAVDSTSFWFADRPKHCDYAVETRAIAFDQLDAALVSPDEIVVISEDPQYTREQFDDDVETPSESEADAGAVA